MITHLSFLRSCQSVEESWLQSRKTKKAPQWWLQVCGMKKCHMEQPCRCWAFQQFQQPCCSLTAWTRWREKDSNKPLIQLATFSLTEFDFDFLCWTFGLGIAANPSSESLAVFPPFLNFFEFLNFRLFLVMSATLSLTRLQSKVRSWRNFKNLLSLRLHSLFSLAAFASHHLLEFTGTTAWICCTTKDCDSEVITWASTIPRTQSTEFDSKAGNLCCAFHLELHSGGRKVFIRFRKKLWHQWNLQTPGSLRELSSANNKRYSITEWIHLWKERSLMPLIFELCTFFGIQGNLSTSLQLQREHLKILSNTVTQVAEKVLCQRITYFDHGCQLLMRIHDIRQSSCKNCWNRQVLMNLKQQAPFVWSKTPPILN